MSKIAYIQAKSTCFEKDEHTFHTTITESDFGKILLMAQTCLRLHLDSCTQEGGVHTVSGGTITEDSSVELLAEGENQVPAMSDGLWSEFCKMHASDTHVWWTYRIKGIDGALWCTSFISIADIGIVF